MLRTFFLIANICVGIIVSRNPICSCSHQKYTQTPTLVISSIKTNTTRVLPITKGFSKSVKVSIGRPLSWLYTSSRETLATYVFASISCTKIFFPSKWSFNTMKTLGLQRRTRFGHATAKGTPFLICQKRPDISEMLFISVAPSFKILASSVFGLMLNISAALGAGSRERQSARSVGIGK